jgi:hypothetical protein
MGESFIVRDKVQLQQDISANRCRLRHTLASKAETFMSKHKIADVKTEYANGYTATVTDVNGNTAESKKADSMSGGHSTAKEAIDSAIEQLPDKEDE